MQKHLRGRGRERWQRRCRRGSRSGTRWTWTFPFGRATRCSVQSQEKEAGGRRDSPTRYARCGCITSALQLAARLIPAHLSSRLAQISLLLVPRGQVSALPSSRDLILTLVLPGAGTLLGSSYSPPPISHVCLLGPALPCLAIYNEYDAWPSILGTVLDCTAPPAPHANQCRSRALSKRSIARK